MKNKPAVFLTSLAVSAISLAVPLPAASTVLDLFIGEEIAMQDLAPTNCKTRQQTTFETGSADRQQEHNSASDGGSTKLLRKLSEQTNSSEADTKAAFPLISNLLFYDTGSKSFISMVPEENHIEVNQHKGVLQL